MKLWTIHVQIGVSEAIGSDVLNFVKDVPRVLKCFLRWGSTPKHFLIGYKIKLWTILIHMGVPEVIRLDVPNFVKDVPDFVKDVPRVPKCFPRWGLAPNHFLMGF